MLTSITTTPSGIHFKDYPFWPASIYPNGILAWEHVREIVPDAFPPEIRTRQGEVLFIAKGEEAALLESARHYGIPAVKRVDVWSLLLDPFLDTEFDDKIQAACASILSQNGIDATHSSAIRERFSSLMDAYNFDTGLWDWLHLGLYDLLLAHCLFPTHSDFRAVYWETMQIAEKALKLPSQ